MIQTKKKALIFIISGPSGSGKSTLLQNLLKDRQLHNKLVRSISLTTRTKRLGEREGRDYFFVSQEQFQLLQKAKKILEWTKYSGYFYGTPKDYIERQLKKSRNVILCLDFRGTVQIKRRYPDRIVTIFVLPPSIKTLFHRVRQRCEQTKTEEIRRRLKLAHRELLLRDKYDYCVVNKNLKQATKKLKNIVLKEISF